MQGLPEAFDTALGLRGVGGDVADAEFLQDAAEVGRVLRAPQLFLEGPVRIVAHEDSEAIAVEGQGQAVGGAERVQQGGIAVQVLGGTEGQGQAGAGGVVDGAMQGQRRAVELHEGAHLGFWRPSGADLAAPAPARGGQPEAAPEPPHRAAAERQALHLPQLFGEVAVVSPP